jgi:hypothetical protein
MIGLLLSCGQGLLRTQAHGGCALKAPLRLHVLSPSLVRVRVSSLRCFLISSVKGAGARPLPSSGRSGFLTPNWYCACEHSVVRWTVRPLRMGVLSPPSCSERVRSVPTFLTSCEQTTRLKVVGAVRPHRELVRPFFATHWVVDWLIAGVLPPPHWYYACELCVFLSLLL